MPSRLASLCAIAHLDGELLRRLVDDRLPVKTHHGDIARLDALLGQQSFHRFGMRAGDEALRLRQSRRAATADR